MAKFASKNQINNNDNSFNNNYLIPKDKKNTMQISSYSMIKTNTLPVNTNIISSKKSSSKANSKQKMKIEVNKVTKIKETSKPKNAIQKSTSKPSRPISHSTSNSQGHYFLNHIKGSEKSSEHTTVSKGKAEGIKLRHTNTLNKILIEFRKDLSHPKD